MKKILLVALAAAGMVSCSQNEEIENAAQKAEIKVGTVVSKTTRAAITDIDALAKEGFTVYAYNTGSTAMTAVEAGGLDVAFMNGVKATFTANTWNLSDGPHYWPLNDKVQFFAYATYATNHATYTLAAGDIYPTVAYTVAATAADQKDFVVATALDKTKTTDAITLQFIHALTQVNFSVQGGNANLNYKVSSISIEGVAGSGVYSFGTGKWTAATEKTAVYSYPISADGSDVAIVGTEVKDLAQTDGALMLMPQEMTASAIIKIKYSVFDGATLIDELTSNVELNGKTAWAAGSKLRYTLTLASEGAAISFAPEVGPWASETPAGN